ncbi:MAG: hypothetical protein II349_01560 [Akkermansia sp.]|nr:hypothetical protein [Akkermansia sp.]
MSVPINLSLFFFLGKHEIRWYCHAGMRVMSESNVYGLTAVAAFVLALSSCQSVTPATRIAENPVLFRSLPVEQQILVQQGRICEGMSQDAVFLAWGAPNNPPYEGQKNGKNVVRWVYTFQEPVMAAPTVGVTVVGPYGWYGPAMYGPSTVYVPREAATVQFENNKVVSWEKRK